MKKLLILAAVLSLAASTAFAQADPGVNGIGVYFDLQGNSNCLQAPTPYTMVTAYLLGTNLSQGGASGWEATVLLNPATFPAGITLDIGAEALEVLTPPVYQVGYAVARMGNVVNFLTISFFYLGGTVTFGVAPCQPSSFGEGGNPALGMYPGYADPVDPGILKGLTPSSNQPWGALPFYVGTNATGFTARNGFIVATAGTSCVTATENSTWGGVKDLYK